jgi:hypothetical protein
VERRDAVGQVRGAAAALLVALVAGLALTLGSLVPFPAVVEAVAGVAFLGGAASFGVLVFANARASGTGVRASFGTSLRWLLRALWELLP